MWHWHCKDSLTNLIREIGNAMPSREGGELAIVVLGKEVGVTETVTLTSKNQPQIVWGTWQLASAQCLRRRRCYNWVTDSGRVRRRLSENTITWYKSERRRYKLRNHLGQFGWKSVNTERRGDSCNIRKLAGWYNRVSVVVVASPHASRISGHWGVNWYKTPVFISQACGATPPSHPPNNNKMTRWWGWSITTAPHPSLATNAVLSEWDWSSTL